MKLTNPGIVQYCFTIIHFKAVSRLTDSAFLKIENGSTFENFVCLLLNSCLVQNGAFNMVRTIWFYNTVLQYGAYFLKDGQYWIVEKMMTKCISFSICLRLQR